MAAAFGIVYPLWDFVADEGALLDRVAGEVGIQYLTVPVVTGARTQFRLAGGGETPHFHTEGGWHFRASAKAYGGGVLKPPKARWFAGGDLLAQVRQQAQQLDVHLMLRLDVRSVRSLVDQERHLCQRNAWGQEVPFAGACPLNPDLRELLRATFEDLHRYEPAGYELVDWMPDCAADRFAGRPLSWNSYVRGLLDICFCASCRQVAEREDIDPDQAARSVRVQVEQHLADAATDQTPVEHDPLVADYVAARRRETCLWLQKLVEGEAERRLFLVRQLGEPAAGNCAPWVPLLRCPSSVRNGPDDPSWQPVMKMLPETSALAMPVWRPAFSEAAELVKMLAEGVHAGVGTFDFEDLSEAAPEAVTWLKQAVRFARRG